MLSNGRRFICSDRFFKFALQTFAGGLLFLSSTALTQAANTIRIGAPLSLTGSLADEGSKEQQGLDMCVDAVNAKGGVKVGTEMRKLEAIKYDYKARPAARFKSSSDC